MWLLMLDIKGNVDGLRKYYAFWNQSDRKRQATVRFTCILFSRSVLSSSLQTHGPQNTRHHQLGVYSNSCPDESVTPSNHLILCRPLLLLLLTFPSIRVVSNESTLTIMWQSIRALVSALLMNIQDWFPLGLTSLISLQSKDSQESSLTPQFKSISSLALSFLYSPNLTSINDYWENHSFDYTDLCQ